MSHAATSSPPPPPGGPTCPLAAILRRIAAAAPGPWLPHAGGAAVGLPPDELEEYIDDLLLDGLARRDGAGLAPTPAGLGVLADPAALRRLCEGRAVFPGSRGGLVRESYRRPRRPAVTAALLSLNLAAFAVTLLLAWSAGAAGSFLSLWPPGGGDPAVAALLRRAGAASGAAWAAGQWWTLATACFLHIGPLHLLVNMVALWRVGAEVEQMWGRLRFLVLYAAAGLGGSCLGVAMQPQAVLAGASGALCGLLAAAAVWRLCNGRHLPRAVARELGGALLINGGLVVLVSLVPGVSGWGHLGGALAGAVVALALQVQRFGPAPWRWVPVAALLPLPWLGRALIEHQRAADPAWAPFNEARQP
jgi:membrane associated rhomboid family serine protease